MSNTSKCECEHESHFSHANTPNGNPAHKYGVYFANSYMQRVKIWWNNEKGETFNVCKDCADDCYNPQHMMEVFGFNVTKVNNE